MRKLMFQRTSALAACLSLVACIPTELNENQRAYLRDLALDVTAQSQHLAAEVMLLGHLVEGVEFEAGATPAAHAARLMARIEQLPGCSVGSVFYFEGAEDIRLTDAACTVGARSFVFDAQLQLANGEKGPEVTLSSVQLEGRDSSYLGRTVTLTSLSDAVPTLTVEPGVGSKALSFAGPLAFDPATLQVTLTGKGQWFAGFAEEPVALQLQGVAFRPLACLAHAGTMQVGPLDVRITSEDTKPVTPVVSWSDAAQVDLQIDGETVRASVPGADCR